MLANDDDCDYGVHCQSMMSYCNHHEKMRQIVVPSIATTVGDNYCRRV